MNIVVLREKRRRGELGPRLIKKATAARDLALGVDAKKAAARLARADVSAAAIALTRHAHALPKKLHAPENDEPAKAKKDLS
jgi:hypothetical protein